MFHLEDQQQDAIMESKTGLNQKGPRDLLYNSMYIDTTTIYLKTVKMANCMLLFTIKKASNLKEETRRNKGRQTHNPYTP